MARRIESVDVEGPAGRLEGLMEEPEGRLRMAAVVCHPHPLYGGTMHNKVVHRMARGLRSAGVATLRFNFRGVGASEGVHGRLTGEVEDARAALAWLRARYTQVPFALAGFSFGARAITRLGCEVERARWVMAAGYPTRHGSADYLEACAATKILIQSTNDWYGPRDELQSLFDRLPEPKRLIWVDAQDHFFAGALDEFELRVKEAAL